MNRIALSLFTVGLAALVGCESKSPPGGPGAVRNDGTKATVGTPDNSFSISVPRAELEQGESKIIAVSIVRGTGFDQDVRLSVANPPQGVTMKFDDNVLKASVKEVHLTIDASAEAALGEHNVKLTATPAREGPPTSAEIKVEVKKP